MTARATSSAWSSQRSSSVVEPVATLPGANRPKDRHHLLFLRQLLGLKRSDRD